MRKVGWIKFAALVVTMGMISACQTTGSQIGEGIVHISDYLQTEYEEYVEWDRKQDGTATTAFAISRQTARFGAFTASGGNNAYSRALAGAIEQCDSSDCKVYAINGKVVWKNAVEAIANVDIGRGPLDISKKGKEAYDKYQKTRPANQRSVFAVSGNGLSGHYDWGDDLEGLKINAVKSCNVSSATKGHPQDCAIYDIDGEIVWDFIK